MTFTPSRLAVLISAAFCIVSMNGYAQELPAGYPTEKSEKTAVELGEIEVWSAPFAQSMGTQKVERWQIETMPVGNGTISELLKNNAAVQYSSRSNSQSQGEIAPENISFHGERFYNNSWLIDGLSNNDNINPGSNAGSLAAVDGQVPYNLPDGGTQSFWINSDLIESVEVFDSNISAKYGQFTGGVVDANLMSPDTYQAWGSMSYRTTRDSWTQFHFDSDQERSEFEQANLSYNQPRFTKNIYSVNVNQPLSEQAALLFSYNRTESEIPFHHSSWDRWEDQSRLSETYLIKGLYEANNGDIWELGFIYSPHESGYVAANVKDGNYVLAGGGYQISLDWDHFLNNGNVLSSVAYKTTHNEIDYQSANAYTWGYDPEFFDWQSTESSALQGGYGNTETTKETLTIKQDYEFEPLVLAGLDHKLSLGWKADLASARYQRNSDTNIYVSTGLVTPSVCYDNDPTCIAGSQAADVWLQYQANWVEIANNHYSAYLQDQIKFGQLEITAGLRADYDEYLGNIDVAPRFTAAYDLFNNQNTMLFGGVNRYYADSLLAYALSENKGHAVRYFRPNYADGWELSGDSTIGGTFVSEDLNTPYSDEINLGVTQRVGNTELTLKWVNRQGKDQFVRHTELDASNRNIYTLTNDGRSDADSIILSGKLIEPLSWGALETDISFGANFMKNNSTFTSYDPGHLFNDATWAYADGKVVTIDELISRNSFNQPWVAFANVAFSLPNYGLTWSQDYRLTGGYRHWEITDESHDCGLNNPSCNGAVGQINVYEEVDYSARFVTDWHLSYQFPVQQHEATISLDVLNVLNSKVEGEASNIGSGSVSYQPGRRFWLNLHYRW